MFGSEKKSINIDNLYAYASDQGQTLLPTENFDFWQPYEANYQKFDRYFYQKYRAFKVCQEYDNSVTYEYMLTDWKTIVDAHLFINQKRYSELYRVQVLAANAYDIVNNYDLTEEIDRTNTGTVSDSIGQRLDTAVHGGASSSTQYGARTDSNQTQLGAQTSNSTQKRSAFNSSTMQDVSGGDISNGARTDTASFTTGAHTDTTIEQSRTDSLTQGSQNNQRTDNLREQSSLHRYGNIGVQTPADVVGGHIDLWEAFRFYQMIFDEVAANYLSIDVDFDFTSTASSGAGGGNAELMQAIRALSAQLTAAQSSINTNVDSAETNIMGELTDVRIDITDVHDNVHDAETNIRGDIATAQRNIRGDITGVTTSGY